MKEELTKYKDILKKRTDELNEKDNMSLSVVELTEKIVLESVVQELTYILERNEG